MLPFLGPEYLEAIQDLFRRPSVSKQNKFTTTLARKIVFTAGAFSGIGSAVAQAGSLRGAVSILVGRKPRRGGERRLKGRRKRRTYFTAS